MPTYTNPAEVSADADNILKVWSANTDFKLKDLTLDQFRQDRTDLETVLKELQKKDDEMTPLRNRRDDLTSRIKTACTRARAGIKGYFGEDSTEYELAGGTRASERKKSGRKAGPASDVKS